MFQNLWAHSTKRWLLHHLSRKEIRMETKFKIGDFVFLKQEVKEYKDWVEPILKRNKDKNYLSLGDLSLKHPAALMIVEITTITCYAGTQVLYGFRKPDGATFTLLEIELVDS